MEKVKLEKWVDNNEPNNNLLFKGEFYKQINFIYDLFNKLLYKFTTKDNRTPFVISNHYSKSVKLPVYELVLDKIRVNIILRCNFYDWCISIESEDPIRDSFLRKFINYKKVGYFEGFPDDKRYLVYDYSKNNQKFSIVLDNDYELYVIISIIKLWGEEKLRRKRRKKSDE